MSDREAFSEACGFILPLGKYKGQTLARIGSSDDGLLYLDWLIGQTWFATGPTVERVKTYLSHPSVSQRLDILVS